MSSTPSTASPRIQALHRAIAVERAAVVEHPLYARIQTIADVRRFMEHHVFAVWDFMSLLKALQRELTCTTVPWVPRGDPGARRLVNEIVLAEESDDGLGAGFTSHFELYCAAMRECGADGAPIDAFVERVASGSSLASALTHSRAPIAARRFVESTFTAIESGSTPRIAAAFTIGREDVIPSMFTRLLEELGERSGARVGILLEYLRRHVALDGERHAPMANRLLETVCGESEANWREAERGAREALVARAQLWDGIAAELDTYAPIAVARA